MITRRHVLALAIACACMPALTGRAALAQSWPTRVVHFIVAQSPGGGIDATARIVADRLSARWGQQVVVENRTGGGGNLAAEIVARAEPDGSTVYVAALSHAVNKFFYPSLGYDPVIDFAPVSLIGLYPNMMVVPISSPAHSVQEFIAYGKANPGKLAFASGGFGSSLQLAAELFKRMAGIDMRHVPYRGASQAFNDLIPGRVDVMFNLVASSLPLVRSGQLRGLGVTTAERLAVAPDMPTIAESGLPGFDVSSWVALFAPARTPPAIVNKISADTAAAIALPAVKAKFDQMGVVVVGSTPAGLAEHLKAEMDKWGSLIKAAGITVRDGNQ